MKAAIIGCGLIGKRRATNLQGVELIACADIYLERAKKLFPKRAAYENWEKMLDENQEIDLVIAATSHSELPRIAQKVIKSQKHLLLEKPAATSSLQIDKLEALAQEKGGIVHVGYNHRYHRAFQKAKKLIEQGAIGELMYIRARYGHGGRIGYDKEWRAHPHLSGGGELMDQGVHLIDLSRWILESSFCEIQGFSHTYFWDMPVEDNGFLLLKTPKNQIAFLHASCTEWKNLFSFEIYGKKGKLMIDGLGGSYGLEKLTYYKMLKEMGPPETVIWEYPRQDNSWEVEFKHFLQSIKEGKNLGPTLADAKETLKIIETVYESSKQMALL